jgi:hypothetical protein
MPGFFRPNLVEIYPVVFEKKIFKDFAYKPCGCGMVEPMVMI